MGQALAFIAKGRISSVWKFSRSLVSSVSLASLPKNGFLLGACGQEGNRFSKTRDARKWPFGFAMKNMRSKLNRHRASSIANFSSASFVEFLAPKCLSKASNKSRKEE